MPKKQKQIVVSSAPTPAPILTVADLSKSGQELLRGALEDAGKLHIVAPELLHAIVAGGALSEHNDILDDVVMDLGDRLYQADESKAAIDALCDKLEAIGISVRVAPSTEKETGDHLTDVAFEYAFAAARGAYVLGVLVGRTMGGAR